MVIIIGMVTIIEIVVILRILPSYRMVTILKDCKDSKGLGCLMIFDNRRDGELPRDGDCPRDGDHHRYDGK